VSGLRRSGSAVYVQVAPSSSIGTSVSDISPVSTYLVPFLKGAVDMMTSSDAIAYDFEKSSQGDRLAKARRYFRFSVPQGMKELDEGKATERMGSLTDHYLGGRRVGEDVASCAWSLLHVDEFRNDDI